MFFALLFGIILLYFSLPNPVGYVPFGIFIAFVPLFILNRRTSGLKRFAINYLFSELYTLLMLFPMDITKACIPFTDMLLSIAAFSMIAFVYALIFTFMAALCDRFGWNISPILLAAGWATAQLMLSKILFAMPIESALFQHPAMIQSARIFGAAFVGSMIIFTNAVLSNAFALNKKRTWLISLSILAVMHISNLAYGSIQLDHSKAGALIQRISIIQPNISSKDSMLIEQSKFFGDLYSKRMISLSKYALKECPNLIIWPEMAGNYVLQDDAYLEYLQKEVTSKGVDLLIGTNYIDHSKNRKFNIAFILKPDGDIAGPYRKNNIFPFIEGNIYSKGGTPNPIGDVGCMICLESLYPRISRVLVKAGASVLVCISNDASFGNSMIPYIHSAQMIFRAIENNRYGVHAGNTGPSIICNNKGKMIMYIPYGTSAYTSANIEFSN